MVGLRASTLLRSGWSNAKPLVEIGFMPEALSTHPEPYRHNFPQGSIYTGWAYPPKDYQKWAEVVFQFVHHLRERYGDAEVKTWLWEIWNEPDIEYWKGTPQEYFKLYDYSVDAVLRALPEARVGGPDSARHLDEAIGPPNAGRRTGRRVLDPSYLMTFVFGDCRCACLCKVFGYQK